MNDPRLIIAARKYGEIRYSVVSESTNDMSRVLGKFALTPDASLLVEHNKESAFAILRDLLWKDMAYQDECMPKPQAEEIAHSLLQEFSVGQSKYFSNGDWSKRESWNPLTESTFDAGLIITGTEGKYFCIWIQDED